MRYSDFQEGFDIAIARRKNKEITMSSPNWTRWSGPAAAAGGALMLAGVLQTVDPEHRVAQKLLWLWPAIPMLFLVAVAGLFNLRYPGWLAKAGLMLAFL